MTQALVKFVRQIDVAKVAAKFPTAAHKERLDAARASIETLVGSIAESPEVGSEILQRIEDTTDSLRQLASELDAATQIGSKAALNEAMAWALSRYVERSIYLAGLASQKKLAEPYASQLAALPAHACLARYRQSFQVDEWLERAKLMPPPHVQNVLMQMKSSYLRQMQHFAATAFESHPGVPITAYHMVLVNLLQAFKLQKQGDADSAAALVQAGLDVAHSMPEPLEDTHYLHLGMHIKNHTEFSSMRRLSKAHPRIAERFRHLSERSTKVRSQGGGHKPRETYGIAPYLLVGGQAASILAVLGFASHIFSLGADVLGPAVDSVWQTVIQLVEKNSTAVGHALSRSTGELAATGELARSTGELARSTGELASLPIGDIGVSTMAGALGAAFLVPSLQSPVQQATSEVSVAGDHLGVFENAGPLA